MVRNSRTVHCGDVGLRANARATREPFMRRVRCTGLLLCFGMFSIIACDRAAESSGGTGSSRVPSRTTASSPPRVDAGSQSTAALDAPASGADPCTAICETTRPLKCATDAECHASCSEMRNAAQCGRELRAFLGCLSVQPVQHWECDDGTPSIKEGHCEAEQGAFEKCLGSGVAKP